MLFNVLLGILLVLFFLLEIQWRPNLIDIFQFSDVGNFSNYTSFHLSEMLVENLCLHLTTP